jgi:hypothetical protein
MSGLGDSKRAPGTAPQTEQWVSDTRTVMDAAQAQFGPVRFFMIGFCSGAEVAHLTALADKRLRAAVLWDFYAFPTRMSRFHILMHRLQRTKPSALVGKIMNKLTRTIATPSDSSAQRPEGMNNGPVTPRDVYIGRFNELARQGVDLFFYYSGGEPEWFAYRNQFRDMFSGQPFYKQVAFDQLKVSDHLITRKDAQVQFSEAVRSWLTQRVLTR